LPTTVPQYSNMFGECNTFYQKWTSAAADEEGYCWNILWRLLYCVTDA